MKNLLNLKNNFNISGLTNEQVVSSRKQFGSNSLEYKKERGIMDAFKRFATEPMVLILLVASILYFINGKTGDAIFLAGAILFEVGISLYQDARSRNALEKLKNFTEHKCKVIRNRNIEEINNEDLVVGDCLMVEEGTSISADGIIIHSNDFSVNESILTGESMPVFKDITKEDFSEESYQKYIKSHLAPLVNEVMERVRNGATFLGILSYDADKTQRVEPETSPIMIELFRLFDRNCMLTPYFEIKENLPPEEMDLIISEIAVSLSI